LAPDGGSTGCPVSKPAYNERLARYSERPPVVSVSCKGVDKAPLSVVVDVVVVVDVLEHWQSIEPTRSSDALSPRVLLNFTPAGPLSFQTSNIHTPEFWKLSRAKKLDLHRDDIIDSI
jgi:hypothetical protein